MKELYGPPAEYLEEAATKALCGVESYAWYYRNEGWLVTFDMSSSAGDSFHLGQHEYLSFAGYPGYICLSIYGGQ